MKKVLFILSLVLLVGAGCGGGDKSGLGESSLPQAPEFSLVDFDGNMVSLSDFLGTPVVINSWAAWCPFCRQELVDFAVVQRQYGGQVKFIAINRGERIQVAKRFTDMLGVTEEIIFLLDPQDSFYESIGGFSMPETLFVNAKGEIVEHKRGPLTLEQTASRIETLITE